ncbi:MAG: hypothetical protein ACI4VH_01805 [Clostridia bacterium]
MKSQSGVTLVSLTVYVIVMAIVVGILANITTFFYKNINDTNAEIDPLTEYTTFNSYFSNEINHPNIKIEQCGNTQDEQGNVQNYIVFSNGVQYTYVSANHGIYKNEVKIGRNIDRCTFEEKIENGKSIVMVHFESGTIKKDIEYTLAD